MYIFFKIYILYQGKERPVGKIYEGKTVTKRKNNRDKEKIR